MSGHLLLLTISVRLLQINICTCVYRWCNTICYCGRDIELWFIELNPEGDQAERIRLFYGSHSRHLTKLSVVKTFMNQVPTEILIPNTVMFKAVWSPSLTG